MEKEKLINVPAVPFADIWALIPEKMQKYVLERKARFDGGAIGAKKKDEKVLVGCISEDLQDLFALNHALGRAIHSLVESKSDWTPEDYDLFCTLDLYHDLLKPFMWFSIRKRYGLTKDYKGIGVRDGYALVCIDNNPDSITSLLNVLKDIAGGSNGI